MNIHEYQAKELLAKFGVAVLALVEPYKPNGRLYDDSHPSV